MDFLEWSKSNVDYGRKLVDSALEGARAGEDEFLNEEPIGPFLAKSAYEALEPALLGACLGAIGGYLANRDHSKARTLAWACLGGAVGFGAGVIWDSRNFTARVATEAWKNIEKTRDEHWFEKNPIDYA
jgi:hypothetical protein